MKKFTPESLKTLLYRKDIKEILSSSELILDIGSGPFGVVDNAVTFDKEDGDANCILKYFDKESFDTVFASHVLEHLDSPIDSFSQMLSLVKPGGYLVVLIPHWILYEKGQWPSFFNFDHKKRFCLPCEDCSGEDLINVNSLFMDLSVSNVDIRARYMDKEINCSEINLFKRASFLEIQIGKILQYLQVPFSLLRRVSKIIDITHYEGKCAQIEILVKK